MADAHLSVFTVVKVWAGDLVAGTPNAAGLFMPALAGSAGILSSGRSLGVEGQHLPVAASRSTQVVAEPHPVRSDSDPSDGIHARGLRRCGRPAVEAGPLELAIRLDGGEVGIERPPLQRVPEAGVRALPDTLRPLTDQDIWRVGMERNAAPIALELLLPDSVADPHQHAVVLHAGGDRTAAWSDVWRGSQARAWPAH